MNPLQMGAAVPILARALERRSNQGECGDLIKARAKCFATLSGIQDDQLLVFSNWWIQYFQGRHGFKQVSIHDESGSENLEKKPTQRDAIWIRLKGFPIADIYSMCKKEMFYCLEPDKTLNQRQVGGSRKEQESCDVRCDVQSDGSDKPEALIISHAKKPHRFQKKTGSQLVVNYRSNHKAWMTVVLSKMGYMILTTSVALKTKHRSPSRLCIGAYCS